MASIQGIYLALFGRPADPLGLDFFNDATSNGADLTAIGDLSGTAEYQDRFVGQSNAQVVTAIYQSLFGRNPDLAGLAFFTAQLQSGAQDINTIAINILDGAQGGDLALVNAKIVAANQFTAAVAVDFDALAAYTGADGIEFGQNFIQQIDSADDVLTDAAVTAQVATFGDTVAEGPNGDTFTLTAGDDFADVDGAIRNAGGGDGIESSFRFTSGNEAVNATGVTLTANDVLVDSSTTDNDTLNIAINAADFPAGGETVSNIESVKLTLTDAEGAYAMTNYTGVNKLTVSGSVGDNGVSIGTFAASGVSVIDLTGVTSADTVGFDVVVSDGAADQDITVTAGNVNNAIVLGDGDNSITTGAGNDFIQVGIGANTIDVGNGINNVILVGDADATTIDGNSTITTGTGVDTVSIANDGDNTVSTGAAGDTVTIAAVALGNNTVNTGEGADVVNLSGTGDNVILTGAGNDIINISATATGDNVVTAGVGVDAINIAVGGNADLVFAAGDSGLTLATLDVVTGFQSGLNDLDFNSAAGSAVNFTDVGGAVVDYAAALAAANSIFTTSLGAKEYVFADDGANGWVFHDADGNGEADMAVQLTGVTALAATDIIA